MKVQEGKHSRGISGFAVWFRITACLFFSSASLPACMGQLFPGLEGEELLMAIRATFTPHQLLTETQVKDTLYAKVFIKNDSVRCIYSDLARNLPAGVDPSQWLYGTGLEPGSINLEHSWPQANGAGKGTDGNRNMHHLFPSRTEINSVRGNSPYNDIADPATDKWFYHDQELHTIPASNIDAYSESKKGVFEPREAAKGDISRAMMYFWTIYHDDAVQAAPLFFDEQRAALCQWHEEDPVDDFEMWRTERIATYQDGKANPFILDCTLAKRTYCSELAECEITAIETTSPDKFRIQYDALENRLTVVDDDIQFWNIMIADSTGRILFRTKLESNRHSEPLGLPGGIYFLLAESKKRVVAHMIFIP